MRFQATHDVTIEDVVRALRLTRRWTDLPVRIIVVVVLAVILSQVLYAFGLYLHAAAGSTHTLLDLLLFGSGAGSGALAWLSILVTLSLPAFLFYSVRALAETLRPASKARRHMRDSDIFGTTTYAIDDHGVRSTRAGGIDVFMPWSAFDDLQSDAVTAVLLRGRRPLFFVPLQAFGGECTAVLTHMRSHMPPSAS